MSLLSSDIRSLAQGLLHDHKTRTKAVADLRTSVKIELNQYSISLRKMSLEQEKALRIHMKELHLQVRSMQKSVATFLLYLKKNREIAALELNKELTDQHTRLITETGAFLNNLSVSHREMSKYQAQKLKKHTQKLRREVKTSLKTMDRDHQAMAMAQKKSLVKGRNQLVMEASAAARMNQSVQKAVRKDQSEASKTWSSLSKTKQKASSKKVAFAGSPTAENTWVSTTPVILSDPDDRK
ncbi:MAG: hypothetical protein NTZ74_01765 [Chloroflexi bacterium]|nr:hypothetical protein [Chloroflexota bacterium]